MTFLSVYGITEPASDRRVENRHRPQVPPLELPTMPCRNKSWLRVKSIVRRQLLFPLATIRFTGRLWRFDSRMPTAHRSSLGGLVWYVDCVSAKSGLVKCHRKTCCLLASIDCFVIACGLLGGRLWSIISPRRFLCWWFHCSI